MKKIIEGHVYDTDKATEIGCADNGLAYNDLNWVRDTLYRTRSGRYFIHGEGGANTRYAEVRENNSWIAGERITPMLTREARIWAEQNLDADEYEAAFSVPEEDTSRVVTSVSLTPAAKAKLERLAEGRSASAVVEELIVAAKGDATNTYAKQDIIELMGGKTFGDVEIYGDSEGWQTDDLTSPEGLENEIYSDINDIPDIEYSDYWLMDKETYKRTVLANSPIDADDYGPYPILCLKAAGR